MSENLNQGRMMRPKYIFDKITNLMNFILKVVDPKPFAKIPALWYFHSAVFMGLNKWVQTWCWPLGSCEYGKFPRFHRGSGWPAGLASNATQTGMSTIRKIVAVKQLLKLRVLNHPWAAPVNQLWPIAVTNFSARFLPISNSSCPRENHGPVSSRTQAAPETIQGPPNLA